MLNQDYEIIQILGEGSFGTVFLVKNQLEKCYALKKVHVNPFQVDEALTEINLMEKFTHQNIIKIVASKFDNNNQCLQILMEYCEEGDLLSFFSKKNKKINLQEILQILHQIVKAFVFMNISGLIHRDLKPENILVTSSGTIKVTDFGCARTITQSFVSKLQNMSYDKGTPIFSSPQQLEGLPYSARCDVWAMGCIVHFLYFGYHPFHGARIEQTLEKIRTLTKDKIFMINQQTNPTIRKILQSCLVYSDRERATWRQLSLSRIFSQKISDVYKFIKYTSQITSIANWITKQFWKMRKTVQLEQQKNYVYAYLMIKFQYSNMLMAKKILLKTKQFEYLFDSQSYHNFEAQHDFFQETMSDIDSSKKYFKESKPHFEKKGVDNFIEYRNCQYNSFTDLDISIKICYKILRDMILELKRRESGSDDYKVDLIWVLMARWINFETELCFEKDPNLLDFLNPQTQNRSIEALEKQLKKYELGVIS